MMCIKCYDEATTQAAREAAVAIPPRAPDFIDPSLVTEAVAVVDGETVCLHHYQSRHPSGSKVVTSGNVV